MNIKERIQKALKQESGLRLSAAEVQSLASVLHVGFPVTHRWRRKPSPSKEPLAGQVRFMCRADLESVVAIDDAATEDAWNKDDYIRHMSQRMFVAKVIERPGRGRRARTIVGSLVYERHQTWIDLKRIVVGTEYQLHSFGRQLIATLQSNLNKRSLTHIRTTIDERSLPMMLFFRSVGFAAVEAHEGKIVMEYYWDGEPRPYRSELDCRSATQTWQSEVYGDDEETGGLKV